MKINILFAIADNAFWKHYKPYGCNWVKTPTFDGAAKEVILFMNTDTPNARPSVLEFWQATTIGKIKRHI